VSRRGVLAGRTAIVTGAAGSLGTAIVDRFLAEGVRAIALLDRDGEGVRAQVETRSSSGAELVAVPLDVTEHDEVLRVVSELDDRFDGLDIMVNNAGMNSPSARIHHVQPEDLRTVLDVNLVGVFNGMKAAIIAMRAREGGAIINTASVAGITSWSHASPYGISKAGVIQLTKVGAVEYAKESIRINCVCPGTFPTSFHEGVDEEVLDAVRSRHPVGRFGTEQEVAGAFVYLASDDARWVTGTSLVIDGGLAAL
jgi:NAD(P)-dependent dehydrogenase (short-subunit alcohol dehydrogenase family)